MLRIENYEALLKAISQDHVERAGQASRYGVRLIHLDDFSMYLPLLRALKSKTVELAELMEHDNYWFGPSNLCDIIMGLKEDSVVVPVSEIIRFYDDAKFDSFISTVLLLQNPGKIRIYIPLVGVATRFQLFWNKFNRKQEGPPVWYLPTRANDQKTIMVYSCRKDIDTHINTINTNKEWLEYWKSGRETPLVTKTKSLINRWEEFLPNGCFEKDCVENSKDVLSKILKLNFARDYRDHEEASWNQLLSLCVTNKMLTKLFPVQILEKLVQINDFHVFDDILLLQRFLEYNSFNRWLICTLIDQTGSESSYFRKVVACLDLLNEYDVIYALYFEVFRMPEKEMIVQRRKLIEALPKDAMHLVSKFIGSWFERLMESGLGIELCTKYSIEEREYLVKDTAKRGRTEEIRDVYPELAAYLNWADVSDEISKIPTNIVSYFKEYNYAKFLNKLNAGLEALFSELNGSKDRFYRWYYTVPELKPVEGYKVVQFDGVGAEWLPYILYCIEQNGQRYSKEAKSYSLRRAKLPTITSVNRIPGVELVRDFDNTIIHKPSGYNYPLSLIKSLDLINDMITKHILQSPEPNICIVADHGSSFLCGKTFGAISMHKDLEAKHEGRYYVGARDIPDNEAFFNVGDYLVAFKHHVISTNVRREVHGGASPEEVLVPCVCIGIMDHIVSKREHIITLSERKISYDNKHLQITITPPPAELPEFSCKETKLEFKRNLNVFDLDLSSFEPGKYVIRTRINDIMQKDAIEIGSGYVEEEMFDD